jgi:MFS family permease
MIDEARTGRTYRCELGRAGTAGILETAGTTFLLLIAVSWFQAGSLAKALVAAAGSFGLLLSPIVVSMVTAAGWSPSHASSRIMAFGGSCFLVAATLHRFESCFVLASIVAVACSAAIVPLLTQMYQENYPEHERGRLFSRTVMIRIAVAALFSKLAGDFLNQSLDWFPWLLAVFGIAMWVAAFCLGRCPTSPIPRDEGWHPLRALRFVRDDALFRRTLVCWMLMGFANLMMLPLRVEYLANPRFNQVSIGMVALLTGVIPNLARLVVSPVWGHLFDRMNFFALRVTLNLGFAVGIFSFFTSDSLTGMMAAAVVFGIAGAGGDVAWSLWVTKFAPPGRVADYMAVHTFLTGVRGALAPLLSFHLVTRWPIGWLAALSSGLILLATLLLLPEVRLGRRAPKASALVEEVQD